MKFSSTSVAGFVGAVLCSALLCAPAQAQKQGFSWEPDRAPDQFWIGRSNAGCTRISGRGGIWVERAVHAVARQQTVEWTCNYVWTSAQDAAPDLAALRRNGVQQAELDAPVVLANAGGDPERDAKWFAPLYALARQRLGIPKDREAHTDRLLVRVAILDGAADSPDGLVDPSGHGRAVSRVVNELACGSLQPCAAQLVHVPALPLLSDASGTLGLHPLEAGALGTRGMLAAAIERTSSEWASLRALGAAPERLVINLSVGWNGCWESGQSESPLAEAILDEKRRSLASRSVLIALTRATCRGALVVAAGGNGDADSGCPKHLAAPGESRHMYPGLWGGSRVTRELCQRVLQEPIAVTTPVPLLIGVGAVDDLDEQLAITDHEADLVAYGQGVVMPDASQPSGWTLALSGTSMSAAALSGIAAAIWSYEPSLPNLELLALIRGTAIELRDAPDPTDPGARDFICNEAFAGGGCKRILRASLCGALQKVRPKTECSDLGPGARSSEAFQTMSTLAPAQVAIDCGTCGAACPDECTLDPEELSSAAPWVIPQPKPPGCGTCALVPGERLFQAEFLYPVGTAVLTVNLPGGASARYALPGAALAGTSQSTWYLPDITRFAKSSRLAYRASISMAKESGDVLLQDVAPFTPSGSVALP